VTARRALPLAVPAVAALLALAAVAAAQAPSSVSGFERGAGLVALAGLGVASLLVRPAWTLSVAIVLSAFSSHWSLLGAPFALDRFALGLCVVSVLARELRHRDGRLQTEPIHWLLILVALYAFVSMTVSGTLGESYPRFTLMDRFGVLPFAMFFVAPFAFRTRTDRQILIGALVALGAYLGLTAVFETTGPRSLVVPNYINDPTEGIHFDRARGPFLEANGNGVALFFCAVASAMAFATWESRKWRAVALAVGGLCMLGVLLTVTRAIWLGAGIAAPLALLSTRETRRYLVPGILATLVVVLGALATIPGLAHRVQKRSDAQQPLYDRKNSNAAALRMIDARPLVGFGWGRFRHDSQAYYRQSQDYPLSGVRDLHNVYLSNAVELGLIGGGLWLLALLAGIGGAIFRRGPPELRPWKVGLIAMATCLAVAWATAPSAMVLPTLLLWTWAGIAWGREAPEQS
jgi:O-antigen ligase